MTGVGRNVRVHGDSALISGLLDLVYLHSRRVNARANGDMREILVLDRREKTHVSLPRSRRISRLRRDIVRPSLCMPRNLRCDMPPYLGVVVVVEVVIDF